MFLAPSQEKSAASNVPTIAAYLMLSIPYVCAIFIDTAETAEAVRVIMQISKEYVLPPLFCSHIFMDDVKTKQAVTPNDISCMIQIVNRQNSEVVNKLIEQILTINCRNTTMINPVVNPFERIR